MRSANYRSTSNAEDISAHYAHSIAWWLTKVICGTGLIASLFLMTLYELPVIFEIPTLMAQALVIVGALTSVWHYRILKTAGDNITIPTALSFTRGLYRWVRHPMYLADMLAYTGLFLLMPNAFTVPILLIAYVALIRQAQVEDAYIASRFPEQFKTWRKSTRLLFPLIY